ncbi:hypothetical protein MAM1_0012d01211 [Mucor ambiguus]|uniref:Uncharacterized protein n=1 Tax=Mucor ambiguus TaxID=91626 RepID=A0A0C9M0U2_9FUNG|nr:hypothetical protein MAM1_0012d01211 [Mucor ambiguus]
MSIQQSQNMEDFKLPLKWRLGTDLLSKMLLCEPKVIDLVAHSLGTDMSANNYTISPTEWADGIRSDIMYMPQTLTKSMSLILLEIQYNIDQEFMLKLIKYSSNAFNRYKILPIVLIVATNSFSTAVFK